MAQRRGRPSGRTIHSEGFEALLVARNILKKDLCADASITPGYLSDLLAHRCGASPEKAESIAASLGVKVAALFPEAVGWVGPLADRDAKRKVAA